MNKKHRNTLNKIFEKPERSDLPWKDIESLIIALGGEISEGQGSRVRIHELMRSKGFILVDPEENEFERDKYKVGIASDSGFEQFSGIELSELEQCLYYGVRFRKLNLRQFLGVYRACLLDRYRNNKSGKNDSEKIILIEKCITKHKL